MKFLLCSALVACAEPASSTMTETHDRCGGSTLEQPILDSPHEPVGSPIDWPTNPPTSGPHYPVWAAWNRHYDQIRRGYWLHDAEHGGVVFSYRCDAGCPDIAQQLDDVVRSLPADPHCDPPLRQRALVVQDPLLPTDHSVYAIAWGISYTASCVDADALTAFFTDNTGRATENSCVEGDYNLGTPLY